MMWLSLEAAALLAADGSFSFQMHWGRISSSINDDSHVVDSAFVEKQFKRIFLSACAW
jgi:hypothetical protein